MLVPSRTPSSSWSRFRGLHPSHNADKQQQEAQIAAPQLVTNTSPASTRSACSFFFPAAWDRCRYPSDPYEPTTPHAFHASRHQQRWLIFCARGNSPRRHGIGHTTGSPRRPHTVCMGPGTLGGEERFLRCRCLTELLSVT